MNLERLDHVALEVADLDERIERLCKTGGMRLLRRGVNKRNGARIAMVGDPTGMKLELIENPEAREPRFQHLAFRSADVDASAVALQDQGWEKLRGPFELEEAAARTVLLKDDEGFELQVLTYRPTSPDIVEWNDET